MHNHAAPDQLPYCNIFRLPAPRNSARNNNSTVNITAPDARRMAVKLAASIASPASAIRHSTEFPAKASMVIDVNKTNCIGALSAENNTEIHAAAVAHQNDSLQQ